MHRRGGGCIRQGEMSDIDDFRQLTRNMVVAQLAAGYRIVDAGLRELKQLRFHDRAVEWALRLRSCSVPTRVIIDAPGLVADKKKDQRWFPSDDWGASYSKKLRPNPDRRDGSHAFQMAANLRH